MTRLAILLLSLPLSAQRLVSVDISIQDSMAPALTGLKLAGYAANVCSVDGQAIQIGGGLVWKAAVRGGLSPVNPHVASLANAQSRTKSFWTVAAVVCEEAATDFALAMGANLIHANPASLAGKILRIAPIAMARKLTKLNTLRETAQPPLNAFSGDALDPSSAISIPAGPGMCVQKLFLAAPGGPRNVSADVPAQATTLAQPAPLTILAAPVLTN